MAQPYSIPNQRVYSINAPTLKLLDNIGALPRIRQYGTLSNIEVMSR
jgi:2-polyprenyl-6-methoxyphenol hydroxylase-like FAD-dependent oxidoreductase